MNLDDTNEAIKRQIDPQVVSIGEVIFSGWKHAHDKYGEDTILSKRSMTSIINDYIIDKAKRNLKGFDIQRERQSIRFVLHPKNSDEQIILIRFKKLTKKLRAMNIRTRAAFNFANQIPIDGDGFNISSVNMNAGYLENEAKTEITAFLTCPKDMYSNTLVFRLPLNSKEKPSVFEIVTPEPIIPRELDNRPFTRQQPKPQTGTDEVKND